MFKHELLELTADSGSSSVEFERDDVRMDEECP
jgi:hypothetical protein